jgi:ribokinase
VGAVDLICVGDVMLDIRVDADTLKRGGDVHGRVLLQPGGTSSNAAVWAAWSGAQASVHGRIGDDIAGRTIRDELTERGVNAALTLDPDVATGTMLVLHEPGDRSMVADRGANARSSSDDLPAVLESGAVLISGYLLLQESGHEVALEALERSAAAFVGVDAASWPLVESFGAGRFLSETKGLATAVLANDREARSLTGLDGARAAEALGERYRLAAVKHGRSGASVVLDGRLVSAPAEPVTEVDPTGAGDAFDGVLLASLARGVPVERAIADACHAGAVVASSTSAWPEGAVR